VALHGAFQFRAQIKDLVGVAQHEFAAVGELERSALALEEQPADLLLQGVLTVGWATRIALAAAARLPWRAAFQK
jgi:hypothetical protein